MENKQEIPDLTSHSLESTLLLLERDGKRGVPPLYEGAERRGKFRVLPHAKALSPLRSAGALHSRFADIALPNSGLL